MSESWKHGVGARGRKMGRGGGSAFAFSAPILEENTEN